MTDADVAIVGAGISGLRCASVLQAAGLSVRMFDKGRRPGGRMSTRRAADTTFDHGAQFFTARDSTFAAEAQRWEHAGWVQRWDADVADVWSDTRRIRTLVHARWVGTPTMSRVPGALAESLDVRCNRRVSAMERHGSAWALTADDGAALGTFSRVVVTAPAGQAAALLGGNSRLQVTAAATELRPCWAVMVLPEHRIDTPFDAAHFHELPLSWAARQSSKPGRPDDNAWLLHASPQWTAEHWDDDKEDVCRELVAAFERTVNTRVGSVLHADGHRWRYALAGAPLPGRCLYDADAGIGACGDWCGGPRVEGAFLSGDALARAMLG